VHLHHTLTLIDMQRRHHHERRAHSAAKYPLPASDGLQRMHDQQGAATYEQSLAPGVIPGGEAERIDHTDPQNREHAAIGLAIEAFQAERAVASVIHFRSPVI